MKPLKPIPRAIISVIIGILIGIWYVLKIKSDSEPDIVYISMITVMAFGYAFGWPLLKKVLAKIVGAAETLSIFALISICCTGSTGSPFFLVILLIIFIFALIWGWVPGIIFGIIQIIIQVVQMVRNKKEKNI